MTIGLRFRTGVSRSRACLTRFLISCKKFSLEKRETKNQPCPDNARAVEEEDYRDSRESNRSSFRFRTSAPVDLPDGEEKSIRWVSKIMVGPLPMRS